jgi:hypothetical protein
MPNTKPNKANSTELTFKQIEIVGQMKDHSFENKNLSFEQMVKKLCLKFTGPNGKLWEKECREAFDRERAR